MKVYHEVSETVTEVSLADAMLKVSEYHCVDAYQAAQMLECSNVNRHCTVMDGTVWIEDSVPVLELDRVIASWFTLKAKEFSKIHPGKGFQAMITCSLGYCNETTIKYQYSSGYDHEAKGAESESTWQEYLRRLGWNLSNSAKVLSLDHKPSHGDTDPPF